MSISSYPRAMRRTRFGAAIGSLLAQDYAGRFRVILVDDNSTGRHRGLRGAAPSCG